MQCQLLLHHKLRTAKANAGIQRLYLTGSDKIDSGKEKLAWLKCPLQNQVTVYETGRVSFCYIYCVSGLPFAMVCLCLPWNVD